MSSEQKRQRDVNMPSSLTVPEVAEFFRVSPNTVLWWKKTGRLPFDPHAGARDSPPSEAISNRSSSWKWRGERSRAASVSPQMSATKLPYACGLSHILLIQEIPGRSGVGNGWVLWLWGQPARSFTSQKEKTGLSVARAPPGRYEVEPTMYHLLKRGHKRQRI